MTTTTLRPAALTPAVPTPTGHIPGLLDLDTLTAPSPAPAPGPGAVVDETSVWAGIGLDPGNPWDPAIVYPHPGGGTVVLTAAESAMALAHTQTPAGARYTRLKALLGRDLPAVAAMVVTAVTTQGSDRIRAASARSQALTLDALHDSAGWTGEHRAELAALWGGGTRTQQVCHDAAWRLHAFLRGLHHPRDRHTPRPGTG